MKKHTKYKIKSSFLLIGIFMLSMINSNILISLDSSLQSGNYDDARSQDGNLFM